MTRGKLQGHRLFLALLPPPDVAARIGALRNAIGPRRHVTDERLHMTMGLLDDMDALDERVVARAKAVLATTEAAPVQICLDRISSSPRTSCLVPSERPPALMALQARLARSFAGAGLPFSSHFSFSPHVTLLYQPPKQINEPLFGGISWRADQLALVHSLLWLSQHIVLQRVDLTGTDPTV